MDTRGYMLQTKSGHSNNSIYVVDLDWNELNNPRVDPE